LTGSSTLGFDHLEEKRSHEQFLEDLNDWAKPDEREWVGLSYRDVMGIFEYWDSNRDSSLVEFNTLEICELFELVEAKLKDKNT